MTTDIARQALVSYDVALNIRGIRITLEVMGERITAVDKKLVKARQDIKQNNTVKRRIEIDRGTRRLSAEAETVA